MRLEKVQEYLREKQYPYTYTEEDGLGSIDFDHRGLSYHIWEFEDNVFMERRRICGPAEGRRI